MVAVASRRKADPTVSFPVQGWSQSPIPGHPGAERGTGFVRATDLPSKLAQWLGVNPRTPKAFGAIPKAIAETLHETPQQFALKNAGIYILADDVHVRDGHALIDLTSRNNHGIINGGHTFHTIAKAVAEATDEERAKLATAYIPVHVFTGIPRELVVQMADGLNRTRQVQESSLENLRGHYDLIKSAMKPHEGADDIAYHEGDTGIVSIGEVLAFLEIFNFGRYPEGEQPYRLYAHKGRVIHEAAQDFGEHIESVGIVVKHLPEILKLADLIRLKTPEYMTAKAREAANARIRLPFLREVATAKIPNGWLYPMLAGFRANVDHDNKGRFAWLVPNEKLLDAALPGLVAICQSEQRAANHKPEWVGKRESAYRQCSQHVELTIRKLGG